MIISSVHMHNVVVRSKITKVYTTTSRRVLVTPHRPLLGLRSVMFQAYRPQRLIAAPHHREQEVQKPLPIADWFDARDCLLPSARLCACRLRTHSILSHALPEVLDPFSRIVRRADVDYTEVVNHVHILVRFVCRAQSTLILVE